MEIERKENELETKEMKSEREGERGRERERESTMKRRSTTPHYIKYLTLIGTVLLA